MIKATALYPEYLEPERLEKALKLAKDGGIEAIRFGEFAWSLIEPSEGDFRFDVFDKAFELTERMGIKVLLCTPTACPPAWLCEKHPDILPLDAHGHPIGFGARQHRCYNSPAMRRAMAPVITALAERYGKRKNLLGWQIDNELGAEHKYCYCDACRTRFQEHLKKRYSSIEELNRRWMGAFWSQSYTAFEQIPLPRLIDATLTMKPHPSLLYEYLRFSSDSISEFCHAQAALLRAHSDAPVTTNQDDFYYGDNVDFDTMFGPLDVVGFDIYTQRQYELGFYFDMCYGIKNKPFWLIEYGSSIKTLTDTLNLAYQKGCALTGLFAFNAFYAGQEQGPVSMLDHLDRPQPNYAVYRDFKPEASAAVRPAPQASLYYDFDSAYALNASTLRHWETGFEQAFSRLGYKEYLIHTVYKALFEKGLEVAVITRLQDANPDIPLLAPLLSVHTEEKANALLAFLEKGGKVLTTDDLFIKNDANAYPRELPAFYAALPEREEAFPPKPGATYLYGKGSIHILPTDSNGEKWFKYNK